MTLYDIAYELITLNLPYFEMLEMEKFLCKEYCIPYNRHVKRRLDELKRRIANALIYNY